MSSAARSAAWRAKYRGQADRRRGWIPAVASGSVRCARGAACRFAEGELGGFIRPGQEWDLGHADGESVGGVEHRILQSVGADAVEGSAAMSGHKTAVCWGSEPPVSSIGYEKPMWPGDSGFSVLFVDAPDPEDLPEVSDNLPPGITLVCLHCLLDEHPEMGRGLDLAREHGVADLEDDGEWVGRRLEGET